MTIRIVNERRSERRILIERWILKQKVMTISIVFEIQRGMSIDFRRRTQKQLSMRTSTRSWIVIQRVRHFEIQKLRRFATAMQTLFETATLKRKKKTRENLILLEIQILTARQKTTRNWRKIRKLTVRRMSIEKQRTIPIERQTLTARPRPKSFQLP